MGDTVTIRCTNAETHMFKKDKIYYMYDGILFYDKEMTMRLGYFGTFEDFCSRQYSKFEIINKYLVELI